MKVAALLALVCSGLLAQDANFKIDVQLVRLLVTVKNPAGDLIGTLDKPDFAVFDKDVPQEITVFEHQTTQPLTLLIDTSGSTAKDLKYETVSLTKFLNALVKEGNPDDAAALYSFNDEVTLLNSFTRRLGRLEDSLRPLKADAGTSLYDAIYLSSSALRDRDGRHVIVVVTDGGDTTSTKRYADALAAAQKADAVFYPIVVVPITNPAGRNLGGEHALETLAESTGGRSFYPTVSELDRTFADILRELRTQYLIGYYPHGPAAGDGKYHRVRLELPRRPDLHISTRTGYYGVVSR
jgi:Ca-activated chloride channel homolog